MNILEDIESRLDDLTLRVKDTATSDSEREYLYSGIRTIKHLVFQAQFAKLEGTL